LGIIIYDLWVMVPKPNFFRGGGLEFGLYFHSLTILLIKDPDIHPLQNNKTNTAYAYTPLTLELKESRIRV
jgi:hypothetical protein